MTAVLWILGIIILILAVLARTGAVGDNSDAKAMAGAAEFFLIVVLGTLWLALAAIHWWP